MGCDRVESIGQRRRTGLQDDRRLDLVQFAVMGSVDYCVDRLGKLVDLGIDKFSVAGASFASSNPEVADAASRFIEQVAPQVRGLAATP